MHRLAGGRKNQYRRSRETFPCRDNGSSPSRRAEPRDAFEASTYCNIIYRAELTFPRLRSLHPNASQCARARLAFRGAARDVDSRAAEPIKVRVDALEARLCRCAEQSDIAEIVGQESPLLSRNYTSLCEALLADAAQLAVNEPPLVRVIYGSRLFLLFWLATRNARTRLDRLSSFESRTRTRTRTRKDEARAID